VSHAAEVHSRLHQPPLLVWLLKLCPASIVSSFQDGCTFWPSNTAAIRAWSGVAPRRAFHAREYRQ
jgi:hypothetical protein